MNLDQTLENFKKEFVAQAPEEVREEMMKAQENLIQQKVGETALKVSETFPGFSLKNSKEEWRSLEDLMVEKDFLVVSFYRGGWCPYCNLELKALTDKLPELEKRKTGLLSLIHI